MVNSATRCKSCQALIVWVKAKLSGRPIPLDPAVVAVVTDEGEVVHGRIAHWASCPQAKEWRKV